MACRLVLGRCDHGQKQDCTQTDGHRGGFYAVATTSYFGGVRWCFLALLLTVCACDGSAEVVFVPFCATPMPLTVADVETIILQAATRAFADGNAYVITVVNRDGFVVGAFEMSGVFPPPPPGDPPFVDSCRAKARTPAFLSSNQHAFNTRTALFIIGDHFPPDVGNAPGGPLYGVQFSSLACSDAVGEDSGTLFDDSAPPRMVLTGNGLSGDFGSMPLYKAGCLIGGVAVDGGADNLDEERSAWAASAGFRPDPAIFGSQIFIDGVRLEFMKQMPPDIDPVLTFPELEAMGTLLEPIVALPDLVFPMDTFGGLMCEVRYLPMDSPSSTTPKLLEADVTAMLDAGAALSDRLRAGIRRPLGSAARLFIAVTDVDGVVLGCIRTPEATLFSFDVAIQKARTAAFFSSNTAAITTRALGFLSQGFFPPGIGFFPPGTDSPPAGPLKGLQDAINPVCASLGPLLANGITIFPGGVPVYKGGVLVGAIGVSGDGVDQDDMTAAEGAALFPPPAGVRCDELDEASLVAQLKMAVGDITAVPADAAVVAATALADMRLDEGLRGLRLPYVKFPRQPFR